MRDLFNLSFSPSRRCCGNLPTQALGSRGIASLFRRGKFCNQVNESSRHPTGWRAFVLW